MIHTDWIHKEKKWRSFVPKLFVIYVSFFFLNKQKIVFHRTSRAFRGLPFNPFDPARSGTEFCWGRNRFWFGSVRFESYNRFWFVRNRFLLCSETIPLRFLTNFGLVRKRFRFITFILVKVQRHFLSASKPILAWSGTDFGSIRCGADFGSVRFGTDVGLV